MKRLGPQEEHANQKAIYGAGSLPEIYGISRDAFSTLQNRSHVLLSLVTICLTITGFSGPNIAAAGASSKVAIIIGLCLVLSAGGGLLVGAFDLQWITRYRRASSDETLIRIIERRNRRTRTYRVATLLLATACVSRCVRRRLRCVSPDKL